MNRMKKILDKFKTIWRANYKESKVPQIALLFWLTKLISTGLGESVSDFSVRMSSSNQIIGALITLIWSAFFFFGFLYLQMRTKRYKPAPYWLTVAFLAVFGTFISDAVRITLGIPLVVMTVFWLIMMLASLIGMRAIGGSISIHKIYSGKAEFMYWLTVALSFIMGTSLGDYMANIPALGGLGLGNLKSGLILLVIFALLIAYRMWQKPDEDTMVEVATFWLAYVLTRPIGASFADYFGREVFGLMKGFTVMGGVGLMIIVWLVIFVPLFVVNIKKYNRN